MPEKIVSRLFVYPIKSLGGIELSTAKMGMRGLEHDRRWMLVDQDGLFLSQRSHPKMALLRPSLRKDHLEVSVVNEQHPRLRIPFEIENVEETQVQVWDSHCMAQCIGKEQDEWFSQVLGFSCRLVYMPDHSIRPIKQKYILNNEHVSFADGYPYLIIGEPSLSDLNQRLSQPVPINRFRPNIVFAGGTPYEEDHWKSFQIGSARFRGIKPCARCQVPTINQDTIAISKEPLKTMAKYRRVDNEVLFGLNACWEVPSLGQDGVVIQVGDKVRVERGGN